MKHIICDICHRGFHSGIIRKCPHPKASIKGIKHVCSYCCNKKCKYSKKLFMDFSCGYICTYDKGNKRDEKEMDRSGK